MHVKQVGGAFKISVQASQVVALLHNEHIAWQLLHTKVTGSLY